MCFTVRFTASVGPLLAPAGGEVGQDLGLAAAHGAHEPAASWDAGDVGVGVDQLKGAPDSGQVGATYRPWTSCASCQRRLPRRSGHRPPAPRTAGSSSARRAGRHRPAAACGSGRAGRACDAVSEGGFCTRRRTSSLTASASRWMCQLVEHQAGVARCTPTALAYPRCGSTATTPIRASQRRSRWASQQVTARAVRSGTTSRRPVAVSTSPDT